MQADRTPTELSMSSVKRLDEILNRRIIAAVDHATQLVEGVRVD